jgi:hypothetical protein
MQGVAIGSGIGCIEDIDDTSKGLAAKVRRGAMSLCCVAVIIAACHSTAPASGVGDSISTTVAVIVAFDRSHARAQ